MSKLYGPMIQQGYIVPDLDAGMAHWLARGVGPWYVIPAVTIDGFHYGKPTTCHITAAFACSGDQQIELIAPLEGSGPNIYSETLAMINKVISRPPRTCRRHRRQLVRAGRLAQTPARPAELSCTACAVPS